MIPSSGSDGDSLLYSFEGSVDVEFNWLPSGIFYRVNSDLHPGENIFTATAVDAADHTSEPADEIVVNIEADSMPDLEVLEQDIYIRL